MGATESDMERKCKIEGEQEEINNLSLCGLYGELQLLVVKNGLRARKMWALQSMVAPLKILFFSSDTL